MNTIKKLSVDLVISTATIQHVGSNENQERMIKNIIGLSKKYFIITLLIYTINRFTLSYLLRLAPKKIRLYCLFLILNFSKEKPESITRKRFVDIFKKLILKIMK